MHASVRFEQVLLLPGHRSSVWGLDVAADGSFCLSAGQVATTPQLHLFLSIEGLLQPL